MSNPITIMIWKMIELMRYRPYPAKLNTLLRETFSPCVTARARRMTPSARKKLASHCATLPTNDRPKLLVCQI